MNSTRSIRKKSLRFGGFACLAFSLPLALVAQAAENLSFDLSITLSAKAAAKLEATGEGITVLASYYGDPKRSAQKHANELGMIDLASKTIELPGQPGPAHIDGRIVPAERLGWLDGPAKINVNLYSSRKASDENILNCDLIDGEVRQVVKLAPIAVHCSLLTEGLANKSYP